MCGLFGILKAPLNLHATGGEWELSSQKAALAFEGLGYLAQERGRHASGFAFFLGRQHAHPATALLDSTLAKSSVRIDGWWICKAPRRFANFWAASTEKYRLSAERASVLLGHTRLATRGHKAGLANASPLLVANLIGTHNGGVAIRELVDAYGLPPPQGDTSSEVIYRALALAHAIATPHPNPTPTHNTTATTLGPSPEAEPGAGVAAEVAVGAGSRAGEPALTGALVEVLQRLSGRAALVWVDRNRPRTVYLARTALSPLSIAYDGSGNFYWASNSNWFAQLDEATNGFFGFSEVLALPEGTLMSVSARPANAANSNGNGSLCVAPPVSFPAYIRPKDAGLALRSNSIWRNFTPAQLEWEQANAAHRVRDEP